jgi:hypothetical protein
LKATFAWNDDCTRSACDATYSLRMIICAKMIRQQDIALPRNVSRVSHPSVLFDYTLVFSAFLGGLAKDRNLPQLKRIEQHYIT